jgi:hypothetical protein
VPLTLFNLSKSSQYSHLRFSLDILGEKGDFGRWNVSGAYVSRLSSCKLVVTANPRHWEGDFRLMEVLYMYKVMKKRDMDVVDTTMFYSLLIEIYINILFPSLINIYS